MQPQCYSTVHDDILRGKVAHPIQLQKKIAAEVGTTYPTLFDWASNWSAPEILPFHDEINNVEARLNQVSSFASEPIKFDSLYLGH